MLENRSSMIVAEWGSGRMTYAKKIKPFAEHDLRITLQRAGNYGHLLTRDIGRDTAPWLQIFAESRNECRQFRAIQVCFSSKGIHKRSKLRNCHLKHINLNLNIFNS